jgi:hypothetical protein
MAGMSGADITAAVGMSAAATPVVTTVDTDNCGNAYTAQPKLRGPVAAQ